MFSQFWGPLHIATWCAQVLLPQMGQGSQEGTPEPEFPPQQDAHPLVKVKVKCNVTKHSSRYT
jgi:hypothetical protein